MRLLTFKLKGKTSFYKRTDQNGANVYSYRLITQQAIKGMLGAIIGLKGYDNLLFRNRDTATPEFNQVFKFLKVGIVPHFEDDSFLLAYNDRVNSTQFGNVIYKQKQLKEGSGLVIKEQWVMNVVYTIYLDETDIETQYREKLEHYLANGLAVFIPYLGRREHFAHISDYEVLEIPKCEEKQLVCISTLPLQDVKEKVDSETKVSGGVITLTELSPVSLKDFYHVYEELLYTNQCILLKDTEHLGSYYQTSNGVVCLYGSDQSSCTSLPISTGNTTEPI